MGNRQCDQSDGLVALLLLGAGSGQRLGRDLPKALVEVSGKPLLAYAVETGIAAAVGQIVVTAPAGYETAFQAVAATVMAETSTPLARPTELLVPLDSLDPAESAAKSRPSTKSVEVVTGGVARSDSVAIGLGRLSPQVDFVLVHDVARAFAPAALFSDVTAALAEGAEAVVPTLTLTDTIKQVGEVFPELVHQTLDRNRLRAVQTPQGFRRDLLASALRATDLRSEATDDAALVEKLGHQVRLIPGDRSAFKITYPFDLLVAETLLRSREVE